MSTQAEIDQQNTDMRKIREIEPSAHVAYFPVEEEYVVHVWGRPISGYHKTSGSATADAMRALGLT